MNKDMIDIVIIGAGPAGMTAAVYASRAEKKVIMLEKGAPGGKLVKTAEIENWPGVVHSTGPDLALKMFEHATAFGAEYVYGDVVDIKDNGNTKTVVCADGTEYECKAVIVATGMKERKMGIPGEEENYGNGISYCAVCDGALFKGREIVVVGGGNSALEEGLYLTQFASKLHIVYRKEAFFRAEQKHITDVMKHPNIVTHFNAIPKEIKKDGSDTVLVYEQDGETKEIKAGCIFPMIGHDYETVALTSFKDKVAPNGGIDTDEKMETKVHGIFAAGDVRTKLLRQVTTAVNDGTIAAQEAVNYINELSK